MDGGDESKEGVGGTLGAVPPLKPVDHILGCVHEAVVAVKVRGHQSCILSIETDNFAILELLLTFAFTFGVGKVNVDLANIAGT